MTLDELFKLLGITEKDAEATRLIDGVVPAVHFVDLGANGEGESGFLVKKGRKTMLGKKLLTKDENGNFEFVKKSAATGDEAPKLSASNKAALLQLVEDQKSKIGELEKAIEGSEEDDAAADMPEAIKTILGGMAKSFETEEPKVEPEEDPAVAAEPAAKKADEGHEPANQDGDDGSFTIGDTVVTGELAKFAASLTKAAGGNEETLSALEQHVAGMAAIQAQLDPGTAVNQAMAQVTKSMGGRLKQLEQQNAELKAKMETMLATGMMPGFTVPDGAATVSTAQKSKPNTALIPAGQDLAKYIDGGDQDFGISFNPEG